MTYGNDRSGRYRHPGPVESEFYAEKHIRIYAPKDDGAADFLRQAGWHMKKFRL